MKVMFLLYLIFALV
jgi:hypothetical protein